MAVKDIRSHAQSNVALSANISTNTTTNGAILDTANFELGLMFTLMASAYTDGTYDVTIEHGNDPALADAAALSSDNLIGTLANMQLTAVSASGAKLKTIGVFGNKRYVRLNIVSTGVTTGADLHVISTQIAELQAVED
jgi:hypothetical protein